MKYDVTAHPIKIRLPSHKGLDSTSVKEQVRNMIEDHTAWPEFLRTYHCQRLTLVTVAAPTIEEILCNVTKPNTHSTECMCERLQLHRAHSRLSKLPETEGHINS